MRSSELIAAPAILAVLLLLSSAAVTVAGQSGGGRSRESEWQTLTKRNFSSEIRRHHHLLLMVTLPWFGESRSLMKEVSHLVSDDQEKFGYLKLRVLYRNSEKMLANILHATEGITLFYYHESASYKYQGRLYAPNILSSIYQFMSLHIEEIPLKPLHTQDDLEKFFQSTDKAVILFDFCGWSAKLLHRRNNDYNATFVSVHNQSDYAVTVKEKLTTEAADRSLALDNGIQKGFEKDEPTCGIESELGSSPWLGGFSLANQSTSLGTKSKSPGSETLCTFEKFQQFESFFSKFMAVAREYYLPLKRQRYGLILERSLLSFVDVDSPKTWLLILHIPGCINSSAVFREGDDIRTFLQMNNSLVMELEVDGNHMESMFPAKRPSLILFVDRSSNSSRVRSDSKASLEVLRKFAKYNQLSCQVFRGLKNGDSGSSSERTLVRTSGRNVQAHAGQWSNIGFSASKAAEIKHNMAFKLINKKTSISLEDSAGNVQDNSAYDILARLLHQKSPVLKSKEIKISLLAKKVGFELLSDDFEVQVIDSLPSRVEYEQPNDMVIGVAMSAEDQVFHVSKESIEDSVNMNIGDSLNPISTNVGTDGEQPKHSVMETVSHLETVPLSKFSTGTFVKEGKDETSESKCTNDNENDKTSMQVGYHAENSFYLEGELSANDAYIESSEKGDVGHIDCNSKRTSPKAVVNRTQVFSSVGEDDAENPLDIITGEIGEPHIQGQTFWGSTFFSDGGYQLLSSLTAGSKIPSLVLLDPILQRHYVFPEEKHISYSSLLDFVNEFLNGSLTSYRKSASVIVNPRETPRPPLVNLDFHETDSIPRVTANTFCELVIGYEHCELGNEPSSFVQTFGSAWKIDVFVLFSTPSCGFCQRMELIVREVYRAFKNFPYTMGIQSKNTDSMHIEVQKDNAIVDVLPSIFLMDCISNDCGSFLKPIGKKELYPTLLLFPAENKSAISYEGAVSVVNILEFLASHGSNAEYLNRHEGFLWTRVSDESKSKATFSDVSPLSVDERASYAEGKDNEFILGTERREDYHHNVGMHVSGSLHDDGWHVVVGSVLASTEKLTNAIPFNNSTIVIVMADKDEGFQGVITNKRISWDIFKELNEELQPITRAPLFYGGPVRAQGLPLVSFTSKPMEGYTRVRSGHYFGNPVATSMAIEWIKSGERSADDYRFYLGYSSWGWNQLFEELAEGAWHVTSSSVGHLGWPDN